MMKSFTKSLALVLALVLAISAAPIFSVSAEEPEREGLFPFDEGVTFHGGQFIDTAGKVLGTLDSKYTYTGWYLGEGAYEICDEATELYGFCDKTGKVLLAPAYDFMELFWNGAATVRLGELYGLAAPDGKLILPVQYTEIYDMDDGYYCITGEDNLSGIADKAGKIVVPLMYYYITPNTGEGLYAVTKTEDGKWGAIDAAGAVVIPFEYDDGFVFDGGLALVVKDGKYGAIDPKGAVVLSFTFDYIVIIGDDMIAVSRDGKWGAVDFTGLVVIPIEYDDIGWTYGESDIIGVMKDDKYGFVDAAGKVVVPIEYDAIYSYTEGLAFVSGTSSLAFYGFIDKAGEVVIDLTARFESGEILYAMPFEQGYSVISRLTFGGSMACGAIDKTGATILPMEYSNMYSWDEGYWWLEKGYKYGLFKDGKIALPTEYDDINYFNDGVAMVGKGSDYAFFTDGGKLLELEEGAKVWDSFSDGLGQIIKDDLVGLVDKTGKTVIPCQYLEVTPFYDGWATAYDADGNWVILRNPLYIPSPWATEHIDAALALGLIPAHLQSNYTAPATRAEFCALAVTLYEKVKGEITTLADFDDTDDLNVRKMAGIGVVNGYGDGTFKPDGTITREESAVLVYKLLVEMGVILPDAEPTFADAESFSDWATLRVGAVQAAGIMNGIGDNMFNPQGIFSREESMITMKKLYEMLNK